MVHKMGSGQDKYPTPSSEIYPSTMFSMALEPYQDAYKVWYNAVYNRKQAPDVSDCSWLLAKWPILKTKITERYLKDKKGNPIGQPYYWYEDILRALWALSAGQEKLINEGFQPKI